MKSVIAIVVTMAALLSGGVAHAVEKVFLLKGPQSEVESGQIRFHFPTGNTGIGPDYDGDGITNQEDPDIDGDGVTSESELEAVLVEEPSLTCVKPPCSGR